ncbi:DUF2589 domain-containing protein [Pseudomonas parafulva]|uniref:DUF2589 domain-containing protein n=1 Tax=Pseudomonas parafulva TaxID=157782 RepID=A0AAI8PB84_9PSED|nr:DUF2589 domain-containing protein [Pseudomonas parafulva]AXO88142.1 DUF2589 domain-containing protein [Pseudomonas parafulva]
MSIDSNLIGSVINALPMDRMIAGPLQAMIQAQVTASKSYADFLLNVCIKDGKAVAIQFDYDETLVGQDGGYQGTVKKSLSVPLLAAITHPNIAIEEGRIEFEMTVNQMAEDRSSKDVQGSLEASLGWGPFKLDIKGSVTHKSEQTRKTDTRARYAFSTSVRRQAPPEAMMRVIDYLTDAATKPSLLPGATLDNPDKLPDASVTPAPGQKPQSDQGAPQTEAP